MDEVNSAREESPLRECLPPEPREDPQDMPQLENAPSPGISEDKTQENEEPSCEKAETDAVPELSKAEEVEKSISSAASPVDAEPDAAKQEANDISAAALRSELQQIKNAMDALSAAAQHTSTEVREMHRLYHNEYAGRLKSMQEELDQYHNADRGKAFDDILGAIARIYGSNESLIDEIEDPKTKKHVQYMLFDLSDLLEEYGVFKLKSNVGDKRNTRHCQVCERIMTNDPTLHDTIAKSYNTGFYKDNRTIVKELVDVYLFDKNKQSEKPGSLTSMDSPAKEDSNN